MGEEGDHAKLRSRKRIFQGIFRIHLICLPSAKKFKFNLQSRLCSLSKELRSWRNEFKTFSPTDNVSVRFSHL